MRIFNNYRYNRVILWYFNYVILCAYVMEETGLSLVAFVNLLECKHVEQVLQSCRFFWRVYNCGKDNIGHRILQKL